MAVHTCLHNDSQVVHPIGMWYMLGVFNSIVFPNYFLFAHFDQSLICEVLHI